jgi:hypothetical protein
VPAGFSRFLLREKQGWGLPACLRSREPTPEGPCRAGPLIPHFQFDSDFPDLLWRRLGLPNRIKSWSLTSLQLRRLMKTGGRLLKHARYYWLLLAEGYPNRRLFGDMLHNIWTLPLPSGSHCLNEDQQLWLPKGRAAGSVGPKRRSTRSINVYERTDEPWSLPAEVMCSVQREKTASLGAARVYTVAVPGPK